MIKFSELLRQRYELKLSYRHIARNIKISVSTIGDHLARAKAASISWPLPEGKYLRIERQDPVDF